MSPRQRSGGEQLSLSSAGGPLVLSVLATLSSVMIPTASGQALSESPESALVLQHVNAARQTGGAQWAETVEFLCGRDPNPGNRRESPVLEPTWLFDDFAVLGRAGTVVYALDTSDGIVLIDSGYPGEEETVLLPGLAQLGLDPADVRYLIVSHGHADHFGGARYMQERFGTRVGLSAADWALVEQRQGAANPPPVRDEVVVEGHAIVVGDKRLTPVFIPGHTPGALGLIFPVRDAEETHMVGLFGGFVTGIGNISEEALDRYLSSVGHFAAVAAELGVDVEIHNHPVFDGTYARLERLAARRAGAPNPFVIGTAAYQNLLDVMTECIGAQRARQAEQRRDP